MNIVIDGNKVHIRLFQRVFFSSELDEHIIYHDLGYSVELKEIPEDMDLTELYREARATNQVEQTVISQEKYTELGQKISGTTYSAKITCCRETELYYNSYRMKWRCFDVLKTKSTLEQLAEREEAFRYI